MKLISILILLFATNSIKAQIFDTVRSPIGYISTARTGAGKLTNTTMKVVDGYVVKGGTQWQYLTLLKKSLPATYVVQSPLKPADNVWLYNQVFYLNGAIDSLTDKLKNITDTFYKYKVLIPSNYLKGDTLNIP